MLYLAAGAMGAAWLALAVKNRYVLSGLAYCAAAALVLIGLTAG